MLTERGRAALAGIGRADSITLDPHKWLYQPNECGCVLVRDGRALRHAFEISSDYLRDAEVDEARSTSPTRSAADRGRRAPSSSGSRCARSGSTRSAPRSTAALDLAELARRRIEASARLELAAPASLGIVCFRRRRDRRRRGLTDGLVAALEQERRRASSLRRACTACRRCASASSTTRATADGRRGG